MGATALNHVRALRPYKRKFPMIFSVLFPSRRLWSAGGIFPGRGLRNALGVKVRGSGVMDSLPPSLTVCGEMWLRRYRCPECRCVLRVRLSGYFERVQAPISAVRSCIRFRLAHGRWPPGGSRCRHGHWLRSLSRKVCAWFGQGWSNRLVEGFDELLRRGENPVNRRI